MSILHISLMLILSFLCFMIICAVLLQTGRGGGMASLGGGAADSAFGAHTANVLQKFTAICVILFFVLVIVLAHTHGVVGGKSASVLDKYQPPAGVPSPALPEQTAPAQQAPEKAAPAAPVQTAPAAPAQQAPANAAPADPVKTAPAAPVQQAPEKAAPAAPVQTAPAAPAQQAPEKAAPTAPVQTAPAAPAQTAPAAPVSAPTTPNP